MRKVSILLFITFIAAADRTAAQQDREQENAVQDGVLIEMPLPKNWSDGAFFNQELPVDDEWWRNFNDPVLDSLITVACESNYSVLSAMENIKKARAAWRVAQSNLMPEFNLGIGWQRAKTSGNIASTMYNEAWEGEFSTAVSMQWQADVFGSIYMRSKAQKKLFMATEEEYNAVMVSLVANVATTYFSLRQSLAEMWVLRENAASQREILNITISRYDSGLASKLDVAQARSVYQSTLAQIPAMQATIDSYRNAMAVLLGTFPEEVDGWLNEGYALPTYIAPIGVGIPAQLLRRRPDIRAAEKQVEANAALLGATKRDWFPQLLISGSIGFASGEMKSLFRSRSFTWEIAPTIKWNIFGGNDRVNATREARATLDGSILDFNEKMLTALQEVESAMSGYENSITQIVALREAVNQNEKTLDLSLELYKQGLTPFQNVLDAQRSLLTYENYLVQAQGGSLIYLVQLYEALGGGW
ncbi:MAG: efflux transporter outer membrane subunit [Bacteroidaceae bacterium]|nr:efflux transporter outer membrane subunit [Bacteroidaceae bacterium]